MKAVTWQRWVSAAAGAVFACLAFQPLQANTAYPAGSLPSGLPELPSVGEAMQRNAPSGLALDGYDPVAYQAEGKPVSGRAQFELTHNGAVWRFASAANREAFRDSPSVYEPAFSGFDPTGVASGYAVESDPRQFAVIGSRLFLFRNPANRSNFVANAALLRDAESNWKAVSRTVAQ